MGTRTERPSHRFSQSSRLGVSSSGASSGTDVAHRGSAHERSRVLIADDSPNVTAAISRVLRELSLETQVTHRMDEVIASLLEFQPNVLLLDVNMAERDATALIPAIRVSPTIATTIVLLFSAIEIPKLERLVFRSGADGYISKMSGMTQFRNSMLQWLQRA